MIWLTAESREQSSSGGGEFDTGDETANRNKQSWSPPPSTRTWFHSGAFTEEPSVNRQYLSKHGVEPGLGVK
jgi:hypothetical protein